MDEQASVSVYTDQHIAADRMQLCSGSCCVRAGTEVHVCQNLQRHEEPKEATDEHEKGTYVYFDYNIMHDDSQVSDPAEDLRAG